MHTGALKKWALALTFWLALHLSSLKAQIFTNDLPLQAVTTGTNPVDFEFRSNGIQIAKGNYGVGSLLSTDQGDGTRMLWFAGSGAFRAGRVNTGITLGSGPWDAAQIGAYSVALGYNTQAQGTSSTALGSRASASGIYSFAAGNSASATGHAATALGQGTTASGYCATAMGAATTATGGTATALGLGTTASGAFSTASGYQTSASGYVSTASGAYTTASAMYTTAIGVLNLGGGNANTWVSTDPLFEIGNGGDGHGEGNPNSSSRSDALIIYKNGNAILQGTLSVSPGGDIPMYTGQ